MTNPHKGEVSFETESGTRVLKLSTNAICNIEAETGGGINDFAKKLQNIKTFRVTDLRTILKACLIGGGDTEITNHQVGDIIDELGVEPAGEFIAKAFKLAFPDAVKGDEGKPGATK